MDSAASYNAQKRRRIERWNYRQSTQVERYMCRQRIHMRYWKLSDSGKIGVWMGCEIRSDSLLTGLFRSSIQLRHRGSVFRDLRRMLSLHRLHSRHFVSYRWCCTGYRIVETDFWIVVGGQQTSSQPLGNYWRWSVGIASSNHRRAQLPFFEFRQTLNSEYWVTQSLVAYVLQPPEQNASRYKHP